MGYLDVFTCFGRVFHPKILRLKLSHSYFEVVFWLLRAYLKLRVGRISQMNLWSSQALLHNSLIHVCHLFQSCKWHFKALSKETTLLHGNKNKEIFLLMLVHLLFTVVQRQRNSLVWWHHKSEARWKYTDMHLSQQMSLITCFWMGFSTVALSFSVPQCLKPDEKKLEWCKNIQPITLIMQLFNTIVCCAELHIKKKCASLKCWFLLLKRYWSVQ